MAKNLEIPGGAPLPAGGCQYIDAVHGRGCSCHSGGRLIPSGGLGARCKHALHAGPSSLPAGANKVRWQPRAVSRSCRRGDLKNDPAGHLVVCSSAEPWFGLEISTQPGCSAALGAARGIFAVMQVFVTPVAGAAAGHGPAERPTRRVASATIAPCWHAEVELLGHAARPSLPRLHARRLLLLPVV